ncbi:MAG: amidase family protein [Oscillospiraceae bacterium]|nr:amidase [Oscillospiraceae bacterium]MCI6026102.1 amidase family protein [Oscillospiraceae bacterium]MDY3218035.1 amidase family protein [Candidatus Fimivivens sp.]SFJ33820.1 amidase [Ruminococcaceae bacterium D5]
MYNPEELTIVQLQKDLSDGKVTSRELVLSYLDRIARLDSCPGGLNSVLELNPEALVIADRLDRLRSDGNLLSGLHGIPIMLKDNINTADRMRTTAGALALKNHFASSDAFIVSKLREAGAIILGKLNMSEYANYMSYHMPGGYSSRGGQVICPYDRKLNPMGSSSGSGVAAATSLCAAAVGTETSGSIIYPSAVNGVVGLKPTAGLISRSGIFPISCTLDTAGPMARTVADVAALLEVMAGEDVNDVVTIGSKADSYLEKLDKVPLKGLRIGLSRASTQPKCTDKAIEALLTLLKNGGAKLIDIDTIEIAPEVQAIMRNEFSAAVDFYLSREIDPPVKTLDEIIQFNQQHADTALKYGQQRMLDAHNTSTCRHIDPEYIEAIMVRANAAEQLDKLFDEKRLDIILLTDKTNYAAFTGFPGLSLPIGADDDGHPACSCWMARKFDEARLLAVAYQVEKVLGARFAPKLG